jgi:hypothetical protein
MDHDDSDEAKCEAQDSDSQDCKRGKLQTLSPCATDARVSQKRPHEDKDRTNEEERATT